MIRTKIWCFIACALIVFPCLSADGVDKEVVVTEIKTLSQMEPIIPLYQEYAQAKNKRSPEEILKSFDQVKDSPKYTFLAAIIDGKVVGFLNFALLRHMLNPPYLARLDSIKVKEGADKNIVANALLAKAEEICRNKEVSRLYAHVGSSFQDQEAPLYALKLRERKEQGEYKNFGNISDSIKHMIVPPSSFKVQQITTEKEFTEHFLKLYQAYFAQLKSRNEEDIGKAWLQAKDDREYFLFGAYNKETLKPVGFASVALIPDMFVGVLCPYKARWDSIYVIPEVNEDDVAMSLGAAVYSLCQERKVSSVAAEAGDHFKQEQRLFSKVMVPRSSSGQFSKDLKGNNG